LLIWKGKLLHQSGRLTLVTTTLSALLIYTAISIELPPWLFKAPRKIMIAFLWLGTEVIQSGKCLVTWERVQQPRHLGGLDILVLRLMGLGLRLHWMWLQRTELRRPWGSMPVQSDSLSTSFFICSIRCILGDGNALLFWTAP
jgi:hypothetical protein